MYSHLANSQIELIKCGCQCLLFHLSEASERKAISVVQSKLSHSFIEHCARGADEKSRLVLIIFVILIAQNTEPTCDRWRTNKWLLFHVYSELLVSWRGPLFEYWLKMTLYFKCQFETLLIRYFFSRMPCYHGCESENKAEQKIFLNTNICLNQTDL